jgi:CheY-like chemotaxis protein
MSKAKVLVVDDDPKLSRLIKVVLEKTNSYEVHEENRSGSAVATARSVKPNIVLLDVDMPGKDGGEIAREMAADSQLRQTPVMFVTSLISQEEGGEEEIMRSGKWFLAKPVKPSVLIRAVDRLLTAVSPIAAAR